VGPVQATRWLGPFDETFFRFFFCDRQMRQARAARGAQKNGRSPRGSERKKPTAKAQRQSGEQILVLIAALIPDLGSIGASVWRRVRHGLRFGQTFLSQPQSMTRSLVRFGIVAYRPEKKGRQKKSSDKGRMKTRDDGRLNGIDVTTGGRMRAAHCSGLACCFSCNMCKLQRSASVPEN
jgi:hypothetical protein